MCYDGYVFRFVDPDVTSIGVFSYSPYPRRVPLVPVIPVYNDESRRMSAIPIFAIRRTIFPGLPQRRGFL